MSSPTSTVAESSSDSPKDLDQQSPSEEPSDQSKNGAEEASDQSKNAGDESDQIDGQDKDPASVGEGEAAEDDDEEGECGFCLFMKGGGCKDTFTDWEKCVEEADKNGEDVVDKCFEITSNLKKCMEAHADYYEPILRAEKAAEEEVAKEIQREAAEQSATSDSSPVAAEQVNSS